MQKNGRVASTAIGGREEQLRQALRTARIAHEFNNQLAVIAGNAEPLRDQPEDTAAAVEAIGRGREGSVHAVNADLLSKPFTRSELAHRVKTTPEDASSGSC